MRTLAEVKFAFSPREIVNAKDRSCILNLQRSFDSVASDILEYAPDCPDRVSAIRKLLECKMMAVHAVTHGVEIGAEKAVSKDIKKPDSK